MSSNALTPKIVRDARDHLRGVPLHYRANCRFQMSRSTERAIRNEAPLPDGVDRLGPLIRLVGVPVELDDAVPIGRIRCAEQNPAETAGRAA